MSSVLQAGPCVRSNQLDFDDETVYKATQYLYDHVRYRNDQPFCLTVSMTHPHDPYTMTKDFWDLYENVDIPLPTTPAGPQDQLDPHSRRVLKCIDALGKVMPEERIKAARRAYFAACSYVDSQVNRLLTTLENMGVADDTIVVFSGDHGDMLGEKGLWYKMVWYEHSARVPLIVHAPARYAAKRVNENVSTMDLLPTFLSMAGTSPSPLLPIDGISLMPYIEDENKNANTGEKTDTVIGEYMGEGTLAPTVMIRRGPWKFVYCPLDPPMLYNVQEDPTESNNLVAGLPIPTDLKQHTVALEGKQPDGPSALASGPAPLPTPTTSPPNGVNPLFASVTNPAHIPTPPRSPSPNKANAFKPANPSPSTSPQTLLNIFLAEVNARWDFNALQEKVLSSQRRRRLVYSALTKGTITPWDFSPVTDGAKQFIRNVGKGPLGDVEVLNRWPRVVCWGNEDKIQREKRLAAEGAGQS